MTYQRQGPITAFLLSSPEFFFVFYAIFASFSTYFCMYAFRKPFAAANFGTTSAGLSCSSILASGIVKDFGRAVMGGVVAQWWAKSVKDRCLQLWGCIFSLCSLSQSGFSISSLSPLNLI